MSQRSQTGEKRKATKLNRDFSDCITKFDGIFRSPEDVELFIGNAVAYKEWASISDKHAFREFGRLLIGEAAIWWRNTESTVTTWDEAISELRWMFGTPAHKVLQEIFSEYQGDNCADVFFWRVSSNFPRLPYNIPELMKVDIVYRLLNPRIKERIARDDFSADLCSLLARVKEVEETLVTADAKLAYPNGENCNNNKSTGSSETVSHLSDTTSGISSEKSFDSTPKLDSAKGQCGNQPKNHDTRVPLSCYSCGREGVIYSGCSTCISSANNVENIRYLSSINPLLEHRLPARRFEVVNIDLFGPLPESSTGKRWLLIIEDCSSHWVELFALENATSRECAEVLISEVFLRFGIPRRMTSDEGNEFVAKVMQHACHVLGITQSLRPGVCESYAVKREKRNLIPRLLILIGKDLPRWDANLPAIRFAMNCYNSTSSGFSPAISTFARQVPAASEIVTDMMTIVEDARFTTDITPFLHNLLTMLLAAEDVHKHFESVQKA